MSCRLGISRGYDLTITYGGSCMSDHTIQIELTLNTAAGMAKEEKAELTQKLREELLSLDVETVDLVGVGKMPPGAKGIDPVLWGQLLLSLAASGGVLTNLINILPDWLNRHHQRSVTLKIGDDTLEVNGISSDEQQELIDAWLNRHGGITIAKR